MSIQWGFISVSSRSLFSGPSCWNWMLYGVLSCFQGKSLGSVNLLKQKSLFSFLEDSFLNCVYVWILHMCAGTRRNQRHLESQVTGARSHLTCALGTKHGFCGRAECTLTAKPPLCPPAVLVLKQERLSLGLSVLSRKVGDGRGRWSCFTHRPFLKATVFLS